MKIIAFTLAALSAASARISFGTCPTDVDNVTNLDKTKFSGRWYRIEQDIQQWYSFGADCIFQDMTLDSNNDIDLWVGAWYWTRLSYGGGSGTMYCEAGNKQTCEANMGGGTNRSDYPILATDYESYSISYSCSTVVENFIKYDSVRISAREKTLTPEKLEEVRNIIREKVPEYGYDF